MLVLSRRESDSLVIGDDIVITVMRCEDGQVRLGISAPKNVNIVRAELLDRQQDYSYRQWFTNKALGK